MFKRTNLPSTALNDVELFLLVGASSSGKSTIFRYLQSYNYINVSFVSLDVITGRYAKKRNLISESDTLKELLQLLKRDVNLFFLFGIQALESYCRAMNIQGKVVVDMGAGFCSGKLASLWVAKYQSICLLVSPFIGHARFNRTRPQSISYATYRSTQFSPKRMKVYNACQAQIDTTKLTEAEVVNQVVSLFNLPIKRRKNND